MIPMFKAHEFHDMSMISKVLSSGMLGEGPMVQNFREQLQGLFDHQYVVPLNSCTSSLILALRLLGILPGDEVISTPFTMIATNSAISSLGAQIVWCDIDPKTFCADMDSVIDKITPLTRAVVLTCVGGIIPSRLETYPVDGPPLILDCAHGLMTLYQGKHISHWGDFSCFSFQAIKHLTTGDGGAMAINLHRPLEINNSLPLNKEIIQQYAQRAEKMKWFGISRKIPRGLTRTEHQMQADISEIGYKFHMNDIAAAIGLSCIEKAINAVTKSIENANYYQRRLSGINGIMTLSVPEGCEPSWWVYGFLSKDGKGLIKYLHSKDIEATQLWRRNDSYACFNYSNVRRLEGMDTVEKEAVFIPNGWWVSETELERIANNVIAFHNQISDF